MLNKKNAKKSAISRKFLPTKLADSFLGVEEVCTMEGMWAKHREQDRVKSTGRVLAGISKTLACFHHFLIQRSVAHVDTSIRAVVCGSRGAAILPRGAWKKKEFKNSVKQGQESSQAMGDWA